MNLDKIYTLCECRQKYEYDVTLIMSLSLLY